MKEHNFVDIEDDDFVGTIKNRFKVIGKVKDISKQRHYIYYKCLCECGNIFYRNKYEVLKHKNGACPKCKRVREGHDNHSKTPLYRVYYAMKQRCYDEKSREYHNYGLRNIKICDEWLESFSNFYNWCISNGYKRGLQIDRIDNDGNYEPSNCRFVTSSQNSNNKRTCIYIEYNGETHTINEWSRILHINKNTFWRYIRFKHYSIDYILNVLKRGWLE